MLVDSRDMLRAAKAGGYGVAAPDFLDLVSARAFARAAQRAGKPIILSFAQGHRHMISLEEAAAVGKVVAQAVDVPIALHLDHGQDIDYLRRAIDLGFTSVMIDASMKPFAQNVALTRQVVALARPKGIPVEAEIGFVGQGEDYSRCAEGAQAESVYTAVDSAVRFVEETGVDSLAVSIGTVHGLYPSDRAPVLNFERLRELNAALDVPLVLHGSSGTGEDNLRRCVREGIAKVNIFTDFLRAAVDRVRASAPGDYAQLRQAVNDGMTDTLLHYFDILSGERRGA